MPFSLMPQPSTSRSTLTGKKTKDEDGFMWWDFFVSNILAFLYKVVCLNRLCIDDNSTSNV